MDSRRGPVLPAGHRAFRLVILLVLIASVVTATGSDAVRGGSGHLVGGGGRLIAAIWRPLLHGDGWFRSVWPWTPDPAPVDRIVPASPAPR